MAAGDFTDVATVVAYLSADPSVPVVQPQDMADGGIISILITGVSSYLRTYLSRNILLNSYTDYHRGYAGWPTLQDYMFGEYPVTSVQSVVMMGINIQPVPITGGSGYIVSDKTLSLSGYVVPPQARALVVQYTAGYNQTPPDIQLAATELVALRYVERGRLGVQSESAAGIGSTTYFGAANVNALNPLTKWAIDKRQRTFPNQVETVPKEPYLY